MKLVLYIPALSDEFLRVITQNSTTAFIRKFRFAWL